MLNFDKNNKITLDLTSDEVSASSLSIHSVGNSLPFADMIVYPQNSGVAIVSSPSNCPSNLGGTVNVDFIQNNNGGAVGFAGNIISENGLINPGSANNQNYFKAAQISGPAVSYPINNGDTLIACATVNDNFGNLGSSVNSQSVVSEKSETYTSSCSNIFSLFFGVKKAIKVGWEVLDYMNKVRETYDTVSSIKYTISHWGNLFNFAHKHNQIPLINHHHVLYLAQHSHIFHNFLI